MADILVKDADYSQPHAVGHDASAQATATTFSIAFETPS
jgi:hypothetical protein